VKADGRPSRQQWFALTCGEYAFVGKCWGTVENCVARKFQITPMDGTARDVYFGQTHLAANKSTSGDSDMGALTNDLLLAPPI
jgi:hypothetical protein